MEELKKEIQAEYAALIRKRFERVKSRKWALLRGLRYRMMLLKLRLASR